MMHRMSRGFGLIEVSLGIAVGSAALVGAVMTFSHVRSGSVARDAYQSAVMIRSSVMNAMMGGQAGRLGAARTADRRNAEARSCALQ